MKKLTLLLVSFFAVFALGLTGCSDDPDVKQETPVIKASNPADIAAVAGKVTVPYTVDYAVDGCSLDVTWDATRGETVYDSSNYPMTKSYVFGINVTF